MKTTSAPRPTSPASVAGTEASPPGAWSWVGELALYPPVVGAAVLLLRVGYTLLHAETFDAVELLRAEHVNELARLTHDLFGVEIVEITIAVMAAAAVIGGAIGLVAWALVALRARLTGARLSTRGRAWRVVVGTVALELGAELCAMSVVPELFAGTWYRGNAVARAVQIAATDSLHPMGCGLLSAAAAAAYLLGPRPRTPPPLRAAAELVWSRRGARTTGLVAALLLAAAWLMRPPRLSRADRPDHRPNILILAVDSLRADRVDPRVAPSIAALASQSTKFDHAYVSLAHTFPSWVTLLTGRHPHHHGIRDMFCRFEDRARDFDPLPARLARAGYATAVVSDYAGDIFSHIDLGFQTIHAPFFNYKQLLFLEALLPQTALMPYLHSQLGRRVFPAMRELKSDADPEMLADDLIHTLDDADATGRPFFVTAFFSTAHFPYAAPYPYYARFTDAAYRGPYKYGRQLGLLAEGSFGEEDARQIRGLYDGAIASVDAAIGRVLGELRRSGLDRSTVVIIAADHGESLAEFGRGWNHGDALSGDEQLHIPLIIHDPTQPAAHEVADIVRDVDLAPTLYALSGVTPPNDLDGRSLVPALAGAPLPFPVLAYAETAVWFETGARADRRIPYPEFEDLAAVDLAHDDEIVVQRRYAPLLTVAKHRMVRDGRWKLVYMPTRAGARYELYDTASDPREQTDVSARFPDVRARMSGDLWSWMLRDTTMKEQDGFLVPRAPAVRATEGQVMRLGLPEPAPSASGAP